MKTIKTQFTILCLLSISLVSAQQVNGSLQINGSSDSEIKLGDRYVVNLFKSFKEGNNKIMFFFDANYNDDTEHPAFNFFAFRTTVKHNGKTIASLSREPMPYIPGDMFLAAETFDFINILSTFKQEGLNYPVNTGALPEGNYEIIMEALPAKGEGSIEKGVIRFTI